MKNGKKSRTGFTPRMESLEERQMLSVNPLASVDSFLSEDIPVADVTFNVKMENDGGKAVFAVQITAKDGSTLDPDLVEIYKGETQVALLSGSLKDINNKDNSSLVYFEADEDGDYTIKVKGEAGGEYGAFTCLVFVPGSVSSAPGEEEGETVTSVSENEAILAQVLYSLSSGAYNENTLSVFRNILQGTGYSLDAIMQSKEQYIALFDANDDGALSQNETSMIVKNSTYNPGTITVTLDADNSAPGASKVELNIPEGKGDAEAMVTADPEGTKITFTDQTGIEEIKIWMSYTNAAGEKTTFEKVVTLDGFTAGDLSHVVTLDAAMLAKLLPDDYLESGKVVPGCYTVHFSSKDTKGNTTTDGAATTFYVVEAGREISTEDNTDIAVNEKSEHSVTPAGTIAAGDKVGGIGDKLMSQIKKVNGIDYTEANKADLDKIGTFTVNEETGQIKFKPGPDYNPPLTVGYDYDDEDRTVTLEVEIYDYVGNKVTQTISFLITPENDPPELIDEDDPIEYDIDLKDSTEADLDILDYCTDPDQYDVLSIGDSFAYTYKDSKGETKTGNGTFDSNGECKITINGEEVTLKRNVLDANDEGLTRLHSVTLDVGNAFDYLKEGETTDLVFTFGVHDASYTSGSMLEAETTVTITGVNDPPVAEDIALRDFDLSEATDKAELENGVTIKWKDYASDPEGGAVTLGGIVYGGTTYEFIEGETNSIKINDNLSCKFKVDGDNLIFFADFASDAFSEESLSFGYVVLDPQDSELSTTGEITVEITGTHANATFVDQDVYVLIPEDAGDWVEAGNPLDFTPGAEDDDYTFIVDSVDVGDEGNFSISQKADGKYYLSVSGSLATGTYEVTVTAKNTNEDYPDDEVTVVLTVNVTNADEIEYTSPSDATPSVNEKSETLSESISNTWGSIIGVEESWSVVKDSLAYVSGTNLPADFDPEDMITYSLSSSGSFSFALNEDYEDLFAYLGAGDTAELTFTYTLVSSLYGHRESGTIKLTVNGVNDAPTAKDYDSEKEVAEGSETGITFTIDELLQAESISDVDSANADLYFRSIAGKTFTNEQINSDTESERTFIAENGTKYVIAQGGKSVTLFPSFNANTDYYKLSVGEELAYEFAYTVTDGTADSTSSSKIKVTITGSNKTPEFTEEDGEFESSVPRKKAEPQLYNASDFVTDANGKDTHYFVDVVVDGASWVENTAEKYKSATIDGVGTLYWYDLDYSEEGEDGEPDTSKAGQLAFAPDPEAEEITEGVDPTLVITFNVSDNSGDTSSSTTEEEGTLTITVLTNNAPAPADATLGTTEDASSNVDVKNTTGWDSTNWNATDDADMKPDGKITVSAHGTSSGYDIIASDDGYAEILAALSASIANGVFTFDPGEAFEFLGKDQTAKFVFTYSVTDTRYDGEIGTGTINVTVTGKNAVAIIDDYTVPESVELGEPITVKASDIKSAGKITDVDVDDKYTFASINDVDIAELVTGENEEDRTIILQDANEKIIGTIVFAKNDASQFTFTPDASTDSAYYSLGDGESSFCTFKYTLNDGTEDSEDEASITVNVTGVNKSPVKIADNEIDEDTLKTTEGAGTVTISADEWFSDVNTGDTLTFDQVVITYPLLEGGTSTAVTLEKGESETLNGVTFALGSDGVLSVTADADGPIRYGKTCAFTIVATANDGTELDNSTATGTFTFTVTGANTTPVGQNYVMDEDDYVLADGTSTVSIPYADLLTGYENDPDVYPAPADTHKVLLMQVKRDSVLDYVDIAANPNVEYELVNGDTIKYVDGNILYCANGDTALAYAGGSDHTGTFNFVIRDNSGDTETNTSESYTVTVNIKGVNKAPVIKDTGPWGVSATVGGNDVVLNVSPTYATDKNGDAMSFTGVKVGSDDLALGSSLPVAGGTITLSSDGTTLTFSPDATTGGTGTITFSVTDGTATSEGTGTLNITSAEGPKFNNGNGDIVKDMAYSTSSKTESVTYDFSALFSNLGANPKYQIVGIDGLEVNENFASVIEGTYESFLTKATYDNLMDWYDNEKVFEGENTSIELVMNQYSWNLQTSEVKITVRAYDDDGGEVEGVFLISPTEQYSVQFHLAATTYAGRVSNDYNANVEEPADDVNPDIASSNPTSNYVLQIWVSDTSDKFSESAGAVAATSIPISFIEGASSFLNSSGVMSDTAMNINASTGAFESRPDTDDYTDETNLILFSNAWLPEATIDDEEGENSYRLGVDGRSLLAFQLRVYVYADSAATQTFEFDEDVFYQSQSGLYGIWTPDGELVFVHPSQIELGGSITVQQKSTPLTALLGPEVAQDGGVYMRTVTETTELDENGAVQNLPKDADWLHEWQSHYVELWVKASEASKYTTATTDLQYNRDYFTAVSIEYGPAFNGGTGTIDDAKGLVSGIGGEAIETIDSDGYVLLGRVRFESIGTDNVSWKSEFTPESLGLKILNPNVETESGQTISIAGRSSNTELWCVPYDVNDSGSINFNDLLNFLGDYGSKSTEDNPFFGITDYNRSGDVNFQDMLVFLNNYGLNRENVTSGSKNISFPESFTQRYVGLTLQTDDTAMVGAMLDAANQAWASALGVEPITVQLAIKDYGDDSTLGEAKILELDAQGRPNKVLITLDDDAAGSGWYSQAGEPVATGRYDLYTTLLHELGHAYGINTAYYAYNSVSYQYGDLLDGTGHVTNPDDVMYYGLNTGERKYLSTLDINIVHTAYGAAANNNFLRVVDTTMSSRMTALSEQETLELIENGTIVEDIIVETFKNSASFVPLLPLAVESKSLAELHTVGLAVSIPQYKDTSIERKIDAYFSADPSEFRTEFGTSIERGEFTIETLLDEVISDIEW